MSHELLPALLGYTGDLIIDEKEHNFFLGINISLDAPVSDEPTFKLALDISFIEPGDRELIEKIVTLGFYYKELDRFATKSRNLSWIRSTNFDSLGRAKEPLESETVKPNIYRRAIANGIMEILSVYKSAVLFKARLAFSRK